MGCSVSKAVESSMARSTTREEKVAYAKECLDTGSRYSDGGDYDAALAEFRKAEAALEGDGANLIGKAQVWNQIGLALDSKGEYAAALEQYRKSYTTFTALFGEESPQATSVANNIGMLLKNMGRYDEARRMLLENLRIRKANPSAHSPKDVAVSYGNVGVLLQETGDLEGAQEAFEKCLAIRQVELPESHPELAGTRSNLAFILMLKGSFERAEAEFLKCLDFYEAVMGKDHPETGRIRHNLGGLYQKMQKYPESLREFRAALSIIEKTMGKDNVMTARNHNCQGDLLSLMDRDEEAMEEFCESLRIYRAACFEGSGSPHRELADPLIGMAGLQIKRGNYAEGRKNLVEALRIQEAAQGVDPAKIQETRVFIAIVDRKMT